MEVYSLLKLQNIIAQKSEILGKCNQITSHVTIGVIMFLFSQLEDLVLLVLLFLFPSPPTCWCGDDCLLQL